MIPVMDVYDILQKIIEEGEYSSPRDSPTLEINYLQCEIVDPWSMYHARKYDVNYFKREFQWYLTGDAYNDSITKHASMWKKLQQDDGAIFSNYGYYWFNRNWMKPESGFTHVVKALRRDPDSRQAYIPMLSTMHIFDGNKDVLCTKGIAFRISCGRLNMHVSMRSSDAIYGLGTDLPCFYFFWRIVAVELGIPLGKFIFSADSCHIYKKHYNMVNTILEDGKGYRGKVSYPIVDKGVVRGDETSRFLQWLREAPL